MNLRWCHSLQAQAYCQSLESERGKAKAETIEEGDEPVFEFYLCPKSL